MSELNIKYGQDQRVIPAPATVIDALKAIDRDVLKKSLAAKVNGEEVDLNHEITATDEIISIEPITVDSRDGLEVLRHSTAHLLAAAVLDLFPGTKLGIGPALMEDPRYGFFYDVIAPRQLTEADLPVIEKKMREMAKRDLRYRRDDIAKSEILSMFKDRDEPLKCELIDEKVTDTASVYYIDGSPFIDFCMGPHVQHTGKLKAFKLLALSGAYWKGDAENEQMQRIYGTAFATQDELDAWLKQREEAEKRDHRKLGRELDLFSISDDYGPGLILWHPKGGIVRMEMERLLREELERRGYSFVFTPHIAKRAALGYEWTRRQLCRFDVCSDEHRGRRVSAKADELSVPHRHLQIKPSQLSRSAAALLRNGNGLSCRVVRNASWVDACAWLFG